MGTKQNERVLRAICKLAATVEGVQRPDLTRIRDSPGSYQFWDGERLIYVGKAKRLRDRIGSYFAAPHRLHPRTAKMVAAANRLEWIEVPTEQDALLLEASLIRTHQPACNVRLRDESDAYPSLWLSGHELPRVSVVHRAPRSGQRFGPYATPGLAHALNGVIEVAYGLRPCTDSKLAQHVRMGRQCLLGDIGKCSAPCENPTGYDKRVAGVAELLGGISKPTRELLAAQMRAASERMSFERAAKLRDAITSLDELDAHRVVVRESLERDLDVIGVATDELGAAAQILQIRNGSIVGTPTWVVERSLMGSAADGDPVTALLTNRYLTGALALPALLAVGDTPATTDANLLGALRIKRGHAVEVRHAQRGELVALVDLAATNALGVLRRARLRRVGDADARRSELQTLADAIGLKHAPLRIECFDNSHLAGTGTVAAMSVLDEGVPVPAQYRRFQLETSGDDYGAMDEVLRKRFGAMLKARSGDIRKKNSGLGVAPDLLVIDGGLGQLNIAVAVLDDLGLRAEIPVVSLAKRLEEVWHPDHSEPLILAIDSPALYVLRRARDEAHRTVVAYQRKQRPKQTFASVLDGVTGLGPKRRERLQAAFGGAGKLIKASREELDAQVWLPAAVRARVWTALHP